MTSFLIYSLYKYCFVLPRDMTWRFRDGFTQLLIYFLTYFYLKLLTDTKLQFTAYVSVSVCLPLCDCVL